MLLFIKFKTCFNVSCHLLVKLFGWSLKKDQTGFCDNHKTYLVLAQHDRETFRLRKTYVTPQKAFRKYFKKSWENSLGWPLYS